MKLQFQALLPNGTLVVTEASSDGPMFPEQVDAAYTAFTDELANAMVTYADEALQVIDANDQGLVREVIAG